ncbi:MAG: MaoC family dehydratase N-terminal domain-containing protein [Eubacterium sp.]|nr:MaoC family dehydratase N-terminal domain-containing protein [Eubacterium sp.]
MTENIAKQLVGKATERRYLEYTWRDVALYALSVGAGRDDLIYTYEKNLKTLPTFGVLPYWGTVGIKPFLPRPFPAAMLANDILHSNIAPLHMEHTLLMHRPIDPIKGTMSFQDRITDVYDRGEGKGLVIKTCADVYDEAGNLLCSNISSTLFHEGGGFGGDPMPKSRVVIPDREPDYIVEDYISPVQNVLYRLTGDTNLVHVDPDYARDHGFDRVFMQGLCSFGFSCRMLIGAIIPNEPERMTQITAQMRAILYPDTRISCRIWKMSDNLAVFRLVDEEGNKILDKGQFGWQ